MENTRTHNLTDGPIYNVRCATCNLSALANNLAAAEKLATDHVTLKGDHSVLIAGRGLMTQVVNLHTLGEGL